MDNIFVAVYTNEVKGYCDKIFFENLKGIGGNVHVVDNTMGMGYYHRLKAIAPYANLYHLVMHKFDHFFLRSVTQSVRFLRKKFLETDSQYFVIVESDVLVPKNLISLFSEVIDKADIIGGIYYRGWHKNEWFDEDHQKLVFEPQATLSGCTLYKRDVLEQIDFRMDLEIPGCFPDSHMSADARDAEFVIANHTKIKCKHLTARNGGRKGYYDG